MTPEPITIGDTHSGTPTDPGQPQWHATGVALGQANRDTRPRGRTRTAPPNRRRRVKDLIARAAVHPERDKAAWVLDNFRLIFSAEKGGR